jgi:hypothetical protein
MREDLDGLQQELAAVCSGMSQVLSEVAGERVVFGMVVLGLSPTVRAYVHNSKEETEQARVLSALRAFITHLETGALPAGQTIN